MVSSTPSGPETPTQEADQSFDQIPAYLRPNSTSPVAEKYSILGLGMSCLRFNDTLRLLLGAPRQGQRLRVHFAAIHTLVNAAEDPDLFEALNQAEVVLPDGMPMVWLGRLKGKQVDRCCGPDTMPDLLDRLREPLYSSSRCRTLTSSR